MSSLKQKIFLNNEFEKMKKILLTIFLTISVLFPDYHALAQHGWKAQDGWKAKNGWKGDKYPYGDYYPGHREGRYGARKAVKTEGEARNILRKYFSPRKATIGEIKERDWFFEAEIKDRNNKPVDRVIIDKRTGRIRSIY